jgi:2,4-dienoyl-CoA reductase-like NADH-dependent reductase (Old Yellow Enzyme family)
MATETRADTPQLFTPIDLRAVAPRNRIVISPMCQFSAVDGHPTDWHFVHLGALASGGAGVVMFEATAVQNQGRITHGDCGLWTDDQIPALARIVSFVKAQGATAAIQLAHAGRKASMQRPWLGFGPLGPADITRGDTPWQTVGASPVPIGDGWPVPRELSAPEIADLVDDWAAATRRVRRAGFDILEIHGAHGYLIQSFLSPIANRRTDRYGGDRAGRMRLALEVTEAVRPVWPDDKPLFFRVSAVDDVEGGWTMADTLVLARELKARGVDVLDCSSGGIAGSATAARVRRQPGFQVGYAAEVRSQAGLMTQAVGLITDPHQAEAILRDGQADLIAIGREVLYDPFWPRHAAAALGADPEFDDWPQPYGWWLHRRALTCDLYGQPSASATAAE